ncbi:MAG: hypothetical protein RLZZ303_2274 [Candidatus Hydrogenedentota bacterium]|jgi:hypothetical protein
MHVLTQLRYDNAQPDQRVARLLVSFCSRVTLFTATNNVLWPCWHRLSLRTLEGCAG